MHDPLSQNPFERKVRDQFGQTKTSEVSNPNSLLPSTHSHPLLPFTRMCRHSSAHAVSINSLDDFALSQIFVHLSHAPFHLTRVCKRWHDMLYSNTRQSEALWHAMCCHRWRSFPPHLRLPSSPPTTTSSTSHFLPLSPLCQEHQVALDATHVQWVLDCSPSSTWRALFRKRHQQSLRCVIHVSSVFFLLFIDCALSSEGTQTG